jgi:hypothetical protein
MVLLGYSGARGTLIYEKNLMSKISCQTPFNMGAQPLGIDLCDCCIHMRMSTQYRPAHVRAKYSIPRQRSIVLHYVTAESSCARHWWSLFVRCEQLAASAGWTLASGAVLYPATRGTCRRWSGLEFQVVLKLIAGVDEIRRGAWRHSWDCGAQGLEQRD